MSRQEALGKRLQLQLLAPRRLHQDKRVLHLIPIEFWINLRSVAEVESGIFSPDTNLYRTAFCLCLSPLSLHSLCCNGNPRGHCASLLDGTALPCLYGRASRGAHALREVCSLLELQLTPPNVRVPVLALVTAWCEIIPVMSLFSLVCVSHPSFKIPSALLLGTQVAHPSDLPCGSFLHLKGVDGVSPTRK